MPSEIRRCVRRNAGHVPFLFNFVLARRHLALTAEDLVGPCDSHSLSSDRKNSDYDCARLAGSRARYVVVGIQVAHRAAELVCR